MKREEIEQAIENGKSVWYVRGKKIKRIKFKDNIPYFDNYKIENKIEDENGIHYEYYAIKDLCKTKAEAEHYLHHANVTRTEQLPFLTWEEFLEEKRMVFRSKTNEEYELSILYNKILLRINGNTHVILQIDLTEQNFYKAYDEAVRLFKGGV